MSHKDIILTVKDLTYNPKHSKWLCPLLLASDAVLCALILWRGTADTEIDWTAYMQQVRTYLDGERDYTQIEGDTGPLVYPAGHVYVYRALYALTNGGQDIKLAQLYFTALYLGTLALVMTCYRQARVRLPLDCALLKLIIIVQAPPYVFPLLVLSKRLHSIYLLRLFNDCFAVGALFLAILAYQKRAWALGSIAYSAALSIKMSVLLALPAVGILLFQATFIGSFFRRAIIHAVLMITVQITLASPFLKANSRGYLSRAFEFTRQFLYKWTVNWRFVDEDTFTSRTFAVSLLLAHILLLALFVTTRWLRPVGKPLLEAARIALNPPSGQMQQDIARRVTPTFILTTVLTANAIGMLCARSLHYQFYSWLAWGTPFLLWRTSFHPIIQIMIWAAQEWAWNVFPSTKASSTVVVGALALVVTGVWTGTGTKDQNPISKSSKRSSKRPRTS
ncbi:MAG: dolichyl-P-Man:Man(5)GlcNAc(2)-PP-dolichol alpha-1,3-mannosyltransferase [Piccolia ochrophora]|nr:MAG: dolichyl-P-Man:Man(5)GlcNAc(2)-PP-dolichol alpha-1,3-mannosyltransferase [Piccolia ochrophora]